MRRILRGSQPTLAVAALLAGLAGCGEPSGLTKPAVGFDLPVAEALLEPPSGYTAVDLTPDLPAGHAATGELVNDSRQAVFRVTDGATGSSISYLWDQGVTSPYGIDVRVFEINDAGQAVGWDATPQATLWSGTTPTALAGLGSRAFDITESGKVTGEHVTEEAVLPFIWVDGVFTDLGSPPDATFAQARDLNEAGQVIGRLIRTDPLLQLGFLWTEGAYTSVMHPEGDFTGVSMGSSVGDDNLNDAGDFVGSLSRAGVNRGFVWSGGVMTVLPTFGGEGGTASELNQAGQVVGSALTASGVARAFVWHDGVMTNLGTQGGPTSRGLRINDRGQVAGTSTTASGETHAFVWSDGAMFDLGTLGGASSSVSDLNEDGEVVGTAETADGEMHAVLWRPSTPTGEVEALEEMVGTLRTAGVLDPEQADGLLAKLAGIVEKIERGSARAAVNQLLAFVHQVEAFVNDGSLADEDGRVLVDAARALMDDLDG